MDKDNNIKENYKIKWKNMKEIKKDGLNKQIYNNKKSLRCKEWLKNGVH